MSGRPTVAAFDVDGTLTRRDCVVPFLRRVAGTTSLLGKLVRSVRRVAGAAARRDRDSMRAIATEAAFAGRRADDVGACGREFAREVHESWLRDEAVGWLRRHRERGDDVVLVSASYEVYLDPLGDLIGAAGVLGTRLEQDRDGVLTGRLEGPNCRGVEKVRRFHRWLDDHRGGRSAVRVVAYGDSRGDRELLDDADEAIWVGGRAR